MTDLPERIDTDEMDSKSEGSEPDASGSDAPDEATEFPAETEEAPDETLAREEADRPAIAPDVEPEVTEPGNAGPPHADVDAREAKGEVTVPGETGSVEQEAALIEEAVEQQAAEVGEESVPPAEEEAVRPVPGEFETAPESPTEEAPVAPPADEAEAPEGPVAEAAPMAAELVDTPSAETVEEAAPEPEEEPAEAEAEPEEAAPEADGVPEAEEEAITAGDPFAGPGEWYVIHTYAGYENKVRTNLGSRIHTMQMQDKIFDVVIPMEDVMEIKGGKKQIVQKKVFPGYLLVRMIYDDDSWYVVRNTPGVTGFVSSGTGQKPTPLPRAQVEKFLAPREEEAKPAYRLEFAEGDVVRIISGPFADFTGTITEINVDQSKVKVLVNIFDRETPVELGFDQVARV